MTPSEPASLAPGRIDSWGSKVKEIHGERGVESLVASIWDPSRYRPLIVVSAAPRASEPTIDLAALAAATSDAADIVALADADTAWLLGDSLPDGLNVFGGAVRLYQPYADPSDDRYRHPVFTCPDPARSDTVIDRVRQALVEHGHLAGDDTSNGDTPPNGTTAADTAVGQRDDQSPGEPGAAELQAVQQRAQQAEEGAARLAAELAFAEERATAAEDRAARLAEDLNAAHERAVARTERIAVLTDTVDRLTKRFDATVRERVRGAELEVSRLKGESRFAQTRADAAEHREKALSAAVTRLKTEAEAAAEAAEAQARADAAEIARLDDEVASLRDRARMDGNEIAGLRRQVRSGADKAAELERRLHGRGAYSDPEKQFRHEVLLYWLHNYAEVDRERFPLQDYLLGPEFLDSIGSLEGFDRDRIVAACVDVVADRIRESNSRSAHQFRTGIGGSMPTLTRDDGAVAWRCAIQNNSASARRLMWWRLSDGRLELAKAAVHDDYAMR